MSTGVDQQESGALVKVRDALKRGEHVPLGDILKAVAAAPETRGHASAPAPTAMTTEVIEAIETLPEVFAKVQPLDRRLLTHEELVALFEERVTIDTVLKPLGKRKDDIREIVCNHLDMEEDKALQGEDDLPPLDDKGHYLTKRSAVVTGKGKRFSRELSGGTVDLTAEDLEQLAEDPDSGFTREDYLACTRQVRILDEAAATMHIRKKPNLMEVIGKAATPKPKSASLYVRNE